MVKAAAAPDRAVRAIEALLRLAHALTARLGGQEIELCPVEPPQLARHPEQPTS